MTGLDSVTRAVTATVLDYFEGWFDGDVERMQRAIHPQLAKRTLDDHAAQADLSNTNAERMIELTTAGAGKDEDPGGDRDLHVEVLDQHANIATVVVRSPVYREYLHLVRADSEWKIVNALWHAT